LVLIYQSSFLRTRRQRYPKLRQSPISYKFPKRLYMIFIKYLYFFNRLKNKKAHFKKLIFKPVSSSQQLKRSKIYNHISKIFENKWLWFKKELSGKLTRRGRKGFEKSIRLKKIRGYKKLSSLKSRAFNSDFFLKRRFRKIKNVVYSDNVEIQQSLLRVYLGNLWLRKKTFNDLMMGKLHIKNRKAQKKLKKICSRRRRLIRYFKRWVKKPRFRKAIFDKRKLIIAKKKQKQPVEKLRG